jgi:hypothetical protein
MIAFIAFITFAVAALGWHAGVALTRVLGL